MFLFKCSFPTTSSQIQVFPNLFIFKNWPQQHHSSSLLQHGVIIHHLNVSWERRRYIKSIIMSSKSFHAPNQSQHHVIRVHRLFEHLRVALIKICLFRLLSCFMVFDRRTKNPSKSNSIVWKIARVGSKLLFIRKIQWFGWSYSLDSFVFCV